MSAEIEIGGIKFTGGKMFVVLTALSSAAGVVWAGALAYQDYMAMKEQITSYVEPDLSGFHEKLAVMTTRMDQINMSVDESNGYIRDIKGDLKGELTKTENLVDRLDDKVGKSSTEMREIADKSYRRSVESMQNVRTMIENAETKVHKLIDKADAKVSSLLSRENIRFEMKIDQMKNDSEAKIKESEKRLQKRIDDVLDNPLSQ